MLSTLNQLLALLWKLWENVDDLHNIKKILIKCQLPVSGSLRNVAVLALIQGYISKYYRFIQSTAIITVQSDF